MHKLRLRGKSQSRVKESAAGNVSKSRIKHKVPSSAGEQGELEQLEARSRSRQPVLRLNSSQDVGAAGEDDEDSFRTSLILPHLTRRFTLLRAKDGSLVSLDQMQAHLRVQRETGRLTENEERAVMQQYRLQSMYEASSSESAGDGGGQHEHIPGGRALSVLQEAEEGDSIYDHGYGHGHGQRSQTMSQRNASTYSSSGQSSSDEQARTPYTPTSSQNHQYGFLSASMPATGPTTPSVPGTGFALSSAADFYAARDAVRGNGLFGGGGLERDVLSKMTKSPSMQGSPRLQSSSRSEPVTPIGRRPRLHAGANGSDKDSLSPRSLSSSRMPIASPQTPIYKEEEEYDPYKPQDSDLGHGWNGAVSFVGVDDPPMTRKQFNRISRALQDIELELTKTHHRVPDPLIEEDEARFNNTFGEQDGLSDEEADSRIVDDEHEHSNTSGYSQNGYMSSTSSSDHHHQHRAFVYDDTEEIDPPLSRLPSQQEFDWSRSPRIAYPEEQYGEEGPNASQPSLAQTEVGHTGQINANDRSSLQPDNVPNRIPSPASPGLAYLQATPPPPSNANGVFSNSTSEQSIASSRATGTSAASSNPIPPLSAVQPSFQHPQTRQNSQTNVRKTPTHSRANSTASSLTGPPLSPPPSCGLPPLPSSASNGSIGSLMMLQQASAASPSMERSASMPSVQEEQLYQVDQPISPSRHEKAPSFSQFAFPLSTLPPSNTFPPPEQEYDEGGRASPKSGVRNARPDSTVSTGSSWRGIGDVTADQSDIDLARLSLLSSSGPASPSRLAAAKAMKGISEEEDEENDLNPSLEKQQEEEAIRSFLQQEGHGLNMEDLRAIQDRLMETALLRAKAEKLYNAKEGAPSTGDEQVATARAPDIVQPGLLASPFIAQPTTNSFVSTAPANAYQPPSKEPISPPHRVPSLNALRGRSSPAHPNSRPSSPFQRPSHLRKDSSASLRRSGASSPAAISSPPPASGSNDISMSMEPFDLQTIERERSEALERSPSQIKSPSRSRSGTQTAQDLTSPATPGSLSHLRPKAMTRTSNATPSMLIRHVQQQANDATAALKQSINSPASPEQSAFGAPTPRRALSHRKSAKNLKIGAPQLVSASANLEAIPSIDTLRSPAGLLQQEERSPDIPKKTSSSAGSRLRMRLNGSKKDSDDMHEVDKLPDVPEVYRGSPVHASTSSKGSGDARGAGGDAHSGIRSLMSKLKRRKPSEVGLSSPRLMPETLILNSPAGLSDDRASPFFAAPGGPGAQQRKLVYSAGSAGTDPAVDISPLVISPKASPSAQKQLNEQQHSALQPFINGHREATDRNSAASQDSMRKLYEAATALGLDAARVNELIDAAGYSRESPESGTNSERPVRLSVVLPPPTSGDVPMTPPPQQTSHKPSQSSSGSMKRTQSGRNRKASVSTVGDLSVGSSSTKAAPRTRHRRLSSEANPPARRSVHDRPPTPPPAAKSLHRRRKSDALGEESSLPASPPLSEYWPSPQASTSTTLASPQPLRPAFRTQNSLLALANEDEQELDLPAPSFMRNTRASVVSARSFGSYDAKSIYGLYGDDAEDEIPPTPGLEQIDMVLASGRILAPSNVADVDGRKRASVSLAPGVTPQRLSKTSRNSRIEMAEFANGDIAFNIIQSLRHGSAGPSNSNRETFYVPGAGQHSRQASDASIDDEQLASPTTPLASPGRTYDADPLRLLVKRHQKANKEKTEAAQAQAAQLEAPYQPRPRNTSGGSLNSSQRSVLEVYEAADEAQVAALIEELTRSLDEGQFNLSRSGTISNSSNHLKNGSHAKQAPLPDVPLSGNANFSPLARRPSKVKRQPAPTA